MKLDVPEISWHDRDPVYSVDFQKYDGKVRRLASAGADRYVRIWYIGSTPDGKAKVEFAANLKRHAKSVNVVRFSPSGNILASGDDDAAIYLWKKNDSAGGGNLFEDDDEVENKESWTAYKMLRGHLEDVYDLAWSPDNQCLLSGSVDNTAVLWDVVVGKKQKVISDHKSFVQGVAWDPKNKYLITNSCDRSCRVYSVSTLACVYNLTKTVTTTAQPDGNVQTKSSRLFLDESTKSFFRRLTFSPDGEMLIAPAGCVEMGDKVVNATHIFTRKSLPKPAVHLPLPEKVAVAVRCSPILYDLRKCEKSRTNDEEQDDGSTGPDDKEREVPAWKKYETVFGLPYRVVFAVATECSILFYDSQQTFPFASVTNAHYTQLTDLAWSSDGQVLVCSSSDGYCSFVMFKEGELGEVYVPAASEDAASTVSSSSNDMQPSEVTISQSILLDAKSSEEMESVAKPIAVRRAVPFQSVAVMSSSTQVKEARRITPTLISSPQGVGNAKQQCKIIPTQVHPQSSRLPVNNATLEPSTNKTISHATSVVAKPSNDVIHKPPEATAVDERKTEKKEARRVGFLTLKRRSESGDSLQQQPSKKMCASTTAPAIPLFPTLVTEAAKEEGRENVSSQRRSKNLVSPEKNSLTGEASVELHLELSEEEDAPSKEDVVESNMSKKPRRISFVTIK
ncbi:PREDICTED: chromatin assembly factor 1 subunit B-like isoform X2 [Priapulus caudatus]|nr:PREDICTED: chromatin assembly factor 1 subunit B-like isoform X2 [Priapulus caudatus]